MNRFFELLQARWKKGLFVCSGLDPDTSKFPKRFDMKKFTESMILDFLMPVVESVHDIVCATKPNDAFFKMFSDRRLREQLHNLFTAIWRVDPTLPIIFDYKRADIGKSNAGYVKEAFEEFRADAATVNPYFGEEAMKPFLERTDKGIIVLCRTSNPGAAEFQELPVILGRKQIEDLMGESAIELADVAGWTPIGTETFIMPFYQVVAMNVARRWNKGGNCAIVVGATAPKQMVIIRRLVGDLPILAPGIGNQGGKIEDLFPVCLDSQGGGLICNASGSVAHASQEDDFPQASRAEVLRLNAQVSTCLKRVA